MRLRLLVFLVIVVCVHSQQQLLLQVGIPIVGTITGVLLLIHVLCCVAIFFECCRNCCGKKRRPAAPGGAGGDAPAGRSSEVNVPAPVNIRHSIRADGLRELSEQVGGGQEQAESIEPSDIVFSIPFTDLTLKLRVSTEPKQDSSLCNSFVAQVGDEDGEHFMKKFKIPPRVVFSSELFDSLENELEALIDAEGVHSNPQFFARVRGLAVSLESKSICVVSQYQRNGCLRKVTMRVGLKERMTLMFRLCALLSKLYAMGNKFKHVNHRYVLVSESNQIRLYDPRFDLVLYRHLHDDPPQPLFYYYSPELLDDDNKLNEKASVFAVGMLLYEILTRNFEPLKRFTENGEPFFASKMSSDPSFRPDIPPELSSNQGIKWFISLIKLCWAHDESSRPDFKMIQKLMRKHAPHIREEADDSDDDDIDNVSVPIYSGGGGGGSVSPMSPPTSDDDSDDEEERERERQMAETRRKEREEQLRKVKEEEDRAESIRVKREEKEREEKRKKWEESLKDEATKIERERSMQGDGISFAESSDDSDLSEANDSGVIFTTQEDDKLSSESSSDDETDTPIIQMHDSDSDKLSEESDDDDSGAPSTKDDDVDLSFESINAKLQAAMSDSDDDSDKPLISSDSDSD